MAEYPVKPRKPDHAVTVGWNAKLQSFWFKVWNQKEKKIVTWVGLQPGQITDLIDLEKAIHRYGYWSHELRDKLKADRDAGSTKGKAGAS